MKFITSQLNAWFENDLWLNLARKANNKAMILRSNLENIKQLKVIYPTHGNEIFVETSKDYLKKINFKNIYPKVWFKKNDGNVILRFVTSFDTQDRTIEEISLRLKK